MAELALDDVQRNTLAGELDGVRMAQLVGSEASPLALTKLSANFEWLRRR
jgi:hypothetical protein